MRGEKKKKEGGKMVAKRKEKWEKEKVDKGEKMGKEKL